MLENNEFYDVSYLQKVEDEYRRKYRVLGIEDVKESLQQTSPISTRENGTERTIVDGKRDAKFERVELHKIMTQSVEHLIEARYLSIPIKRHKAKRKLEFNDVT